MSAVNEIRLAIDAILTAHAGLNAIINGRIVDGVAPEGFPTPYLRYSTSAEVHSRRFGGAENSRGDELLNAFSSDSDTAQVRAIYAEVRDALHMRRITLADGRVCVGTLELVGAGPDDVGTGTMAAMRYVPRTPR